MTKEIETEVKALPIGECSLCGLPVHVDEDGMLYCEDCGTIPEYSRCPQCNGTGKIWVVRDCPCVHAHSSFQCDDCGNTGIRDEYEEVCSNCGGSGYL